MDPFTEYFMRNCLWPAVVFILILLLIGLVGNSLILYIYRHHFRRSTPWLFIYVLAILDFSACVISMPSELVILGTYTHYPSGNLCKFSRYITYILHGSSLIILMAIAFNRYEKVCRPQKQFLNLRRAKILCIGTLIFATITFLPSLSLYGEVRDLLVLTHDDGVLVNPANYSGTNATSSGENYPTTVGRFCRITPSKLNAILGPLFFFFQFVLYLMLVVLVIFFYSRIIHTIIEYGRKQQLLLLQIASSASRVDIVRDFKDPKQRSATTDDQTVDFSNDFCRNEVSRDWDRTETPTKDDTSCGDSAKTTPGRDYYFRTSELKKQISPPVIVGHDTEGNLMKTAESDNNIHLRLNNNAGTNNSLETNQLLMRRIKSSDNFSKLSVGIPQLHVDSIAMFEPLFLHAPKIHKKKNSFSSKGFSHSFRKSKKQKNKVVTRSKSNVDVSMRVDLPCGREEPKEIAASCRSLEGLCDGNMHCGHSTSTDVNSSQDGRLTLTRRTAKGSKNCTIHLTGLSMKSAMSYDATESLANSATSDKNKSAELENPTPSGGILDKLEILASERSIEDNDDVKNVNLSEETTTGNDVVNENNKFEEEKVEEAAEEKPRERTNTVTFKTEDPGPDQVHNRYLSVKKRSPRKISSDDTSRNSESILTPEVKKVDTRRRQSVQPIRAHRTSRMLFWISLAFVLCFLPFWIIVLLRFLIGPTGRLSDLEEAFVEVLVRFTYVSNAINPIIYGFMNTQFRNRCSDIFQWNSRRIQP